MLEYEDDSEVRGYGSPLSKMLTKIREAGFKPIAITVMICEETFVFKTEEEAKAAWEKFKPEGWWYGFSYFIDTREEYVNKFYDGDEDAAPIVYWLDNNYAPKEQRS